MKSNKRLTAVLLFIRYLHISQTELRLPNWRKGLSAHMLLWIQSPHSLSSGNKPMQNMHSAPSSSIYKDWSLWASSSSTVIPLLCLQQFFWSCCYVLVRQGICHERLLNAWLLAIFAVIVFPPSAFICVLLWASPFSFAIGQSVAGRESRW
jgi:hypothetical protein